MKIIFPLTTVLFLSISPFVNAVDKEDPIALNREFMVVGDFDNDGLVNDVVLFNDNNITFSRSINNEFMIESSNFIFPSDLSDLSLLDGKVVAGDFDHDGFIDDIAGIYSIGVDKTSFTVWINNNGQFTPSQWWYGGDFNADMVTNTLVAGDFDRDGFMDDVVGFYNYDETHTKAFVWNSDGKKFGWPGTWWIGGDFNATKIQSTLTAGDFDHDGYLDDVAGLYNYSSDRCKIFIWESKTNRFEWPYTWFNKENFKVENIKGSVVSGDFNNNGYRDDIAALYRVDDQSTKILVWQLKGRGFNEPEAWWYGQEEGTTTRDRIITIDANNNKANDQISGLSVNEKESTWLTWTAVNNSFTLPETQTFENKELGIIDYENKNISNLNDASISVYPNPSTDYCFVTVPNCNNLVNIEIYNITGSLVYKSSGQPGSTLQINLQDMKPGSYLVRIMNDELDLKQNLIKE